MLKSPKVSVIIPNYNHAAYLHKRIESVIGQTYQNLEILILDDCSPDDSRKIIDSYAKQDIRIQTIYNEQNSGSTFKQWAKGLNSVTGEYIWIAESDDYADSMFVEKLINKLEANSSVGLAYCDSWHVHEDKKLIERNFAFYKDLDESLWTKDFVMPGIELVRKFMFRRNIIPNASAVILRSSVVSKVGPPPTNLRLVGDWLYWSNILAISDAAFIAEPLNYFRFHTNNVRSKSNSNGLALIETLNMLTAIRKYSVPNQPFAEKLLNDLLLWWLDIMIINDRSLTLARNKEIYRAFTLLDDKFKSNFTKNLIIKIFGNRLSGLRRLLGDGLIYPIFKDKAH